MSSSRLSSFSTSVSGRATTIAPSAPVPSVNTLSFVPLTVRSVRLLPVPRAAIARSPAVAAISTGDDPCPPGTNTSPLGSTNWM